MSNSYWGGKREGAGRPPIGETKPIKLTLSNEHWDWIEDEIKKGHASSRSEFIRDIISFAKTYKENFNRKVGR